MNIIKKMMKKKGISPVIASIILIAITIAVAIAVAGWVFGLFGTYGTAGGVTITVTELTAGGTGVASVDYTVTNSKSTSITVDTVRIQGLDLAVTTGFPVIAYDTDTELVTLVGTGTLTAGMAYTIQFVLADGTTLTTVATAS